MGMSIDKAIDRLEDLHFEQDNWEDGELTEDCLLNREALRQAIDTMRKYQMFQANYEARLKADLVAMLNEFDLELYEKYEDTDLIKVKYIRQAIQQKIDKLNEVSE